MQALIMMVLLFQAGSNTVGTASDPYVAAAPREEAAPAKLATDDGLNRDKLNRKIGRLEAEVESLSDQLEQREQSTDQQLIELANKASKAEGELRETRQQLFVEKTIRAASVARIVELEKEKKEQEARQSKQNIRIIVGVAFMFAIILVLLIKNWMRSLDILARIPDAKTEELIASYQEDLARSEKDRLAAEAREKQARKLANSTYEELLSERTAAVASGAWYKQHLLELTSAGDEVIDEMRGELATAQNEIVVLRGGSRGADG